MDRFFHVSISGVEYEQSLFELEKSYARLPSEYKAGIFEAVKFSRLMKKRLAVLNNDFTALFNDSEFKNGLSKMLEPELEYRLMKIKEVDPRYIQPIDRIDPRVSHAPEKKGFLRKVVQKVMQ